MNDLMTLAVRATGADYLAAEQALRGDPRGARPELEAAARSEEAVTRLIGEVLLAWLGPEGADFDLALAYLDGLPARVARTPLPVPSPLGAASYLERYFRGRVARLLTLRLIKEPEWADWRAFAVILYLQQSRDPGTVPGLVRFAAETPSSARAEAAIEALEAIDGPGLAVSLDAERQHRLTAGLDWPGPLAALRERAP